MNKYIVLLPPGGPAKGFFEAVIDLAGEAGSLVRALYVVDARWFRFSASDWLSTGPSRAGFDEYMRDTLRREGEVLTIEFSQAAERAGLGCSTEIAEGDPAETVLKAARAWRADAVIIPSGRKDLKTRIEKAGITVTVIPAPVRGPG